MGRVIKIQISAEKGEPPIPCESCLAVEGKGIEGDRHVGKKDREVCICRKELLDWMAEQEVKGICFSRHKENLLFENFSDGEIAPGKLLAGKEAVLKISDIRKHCFPEECPLAGAAIPCRLRGEYQMASVFRSGTIHVGEEFTVL